MPPPVSRPTPVEFAAQSSESHDAYVEHVLARQREIHDLMRRNMHRTQLRQKLKFNRNIQAKAYQLGVLVWVFLSVRPAKTLPQIDARMA